MNENEIQELQEMIKEVKAYIFSKTGANGFFNFSAMVPVAGAEGVGYVFSITNVDDLGELNFLMDQAVESFLKSEQNRKTKFGGLTDKEYMLN